MLRKTLILAAGAAFILSFSLFDSGISTASDTEMGPEDMVLQTGNAKKPAEFPHAAHQEMYDCGECHHGMDADGKQTPYTEGMEIQQCVTCHNEEMADKKLDSFKDVAHTNCKECHKKEKKAGKDAPTRCSGCHPRK